MYSYVVFFYYYNNHVGGHEECDCLIRGCNTFMRDGCAGCRKTFAPRCQRWLQT
jgi:hypothetical protein